MTKTLTEQWKNGTLPLGTYYILNINGVEEIDKSIAIGELWNNTDLKEVLAPVPSYNEYKKLKNQFADLSKKVGRLKEQLEIAMIVLGQIAMFSSDKTDAVQCAKAIKEINEEEQ